MCLCKYICMYVYVCVCVYVCMHVCMFMGLSMCVCMYAYLCVYVCMHLCMNVCMNAYLCVYVCIYVCMYMYAFMYVYVCTLIYVYTKCGRKVMRLATLCTNRQRCCLPLHMAASLTSAVDSVQVWTCYSCYAIVESVWSEVEVENVRWPIATWNKNQQMALCGELALKDVLALL